MKIPRLYVENAEKHENRKVVVEEDGKVIRFLDEEEEYCGEGKILYQVIYDDFDNYILMGTVSRDMLIEYEVGGIKQITYIKKGTRLLEIPAEGYKVYPIVDFGCRVLEGHRVAALQSKKGDVRFANTPVNGIVLFLKEVPSKRENYVFYILPEKEIRFEEE
ncbi:Protein of unknown function DUF2118 [Methanocaldococcus vulcanius M7]|uniref:DUF2118 domain-containing protein n=1 Tax=Methanocaldococcus vulcanius (strain ATCC 700851 / DSM 12094 / M7) TaxID=579137 RepID=C9REZ1_METVM|nr:DUF2118 domain-containing protein [Methanocaldococcus vulcanius]ACX72143.1 Protein of unknown function DUF2118 [Methanocaldococcus vulcanius M7]